jgi:hypothetical protein
MLIILEKILVQKYGKLFKFAVYAGYKKMKYLHKGFIGF